MYYILHETRPYSFWSGTHERIYDLSKNNQRRTQQYVAKPRLSTLNAATKSRMHLP